LDRGFGLKITQENQVQKVVLANSSADARIGPWQRVLCADLCAHVGQDVRQKLSCMMTRALMFGHGELQRVMCDDVWIGGYYKA
jgi:hypothetical protein